MCVQGVPHKFGGSLVFSPHEDHKMLISQIYVAHLKVSGSSILRILLDPPPDSAKGRPLFARLEYLWLCSLAAMCHSHQKPSCLLGYHVEGAIRLCCYLKDMAATPSSTKSTITNIFFFLYNYTSIAFCHLYLF